MYIAFSLWDQKKDVQRRSQSFSEEKKKNLCREHTMGSHHALLENTTIIFCQLFPYAIPSRAPKIFFSLFSLGCALIPTSNNGPNSAFKKGRFVLGVIACVMRVAVTFQRRQEDIVLSGPRTPVSKRERSSSGVLQAAGEQK